MTECRSKKKQSSTIVYMIGLYWSTVSAGCLRVEYSVNNTWSTVCRHYKYVSLLVTANNDNDRTENGKSSQVIQSSIIKKRLKQEKLVFYIICDLPAFVTYLANNLLV